MSNKCNRCKEKAAPNKKTCKKHAEESRIRTNKKRKFWRDYGLCVKCGKIPMENISLCHICRKKVSDRDKDLYNKRKFFKKCTRCGKNAKPNVTRCFDCCKQDSEYSAKMRNKYKNSNICIVCHKNKNIKNKSLCDKCYKRSKEYYKKFITGKKEKGICISCSNQALKNKVRCHDCLLTNSIRASIKETLRKSRLTKSKRTEEIIGCTIEFFRKHIKSLMKTWMNEKNYGVHVPGKKRWQLGHKIPVASFDLNDEKQLKKCFNYTNMFPQEAKENISMGDLMMVDSKMIRGRNLS